MKAGRAKLTAAALALAVSLVMLVSASVAWMTVSVNPEMGGLQVSLYTDMALLVSTARDGDYVQAIDLGDDFQYYAPLRLVSTIDGVNWFLPSYDTATGALKDPSEFIQDDGSHRNVMLYNYDEGSKTYTKKTGVDLYNAENKGYYVSTEFWLMTEQEGGCAVTLSVPANVAGLDTWETDQGLYGSYALASYEKNDDGIARIDNNVQTALRVGFLTEENAFVIYEPNADQRSAAAKKPKAGEQAYISGYTMTEDYSNYKADYYIPTRPIALNTNGLGTLGSIANDKLIIQKAGAWDPDELKAALTAGKKPNSNQVASFGQFVADNTQLVPDAATGMAAIGSDNLAAASQTVIVSLERNVPQKLTLFIWLEGQDVDCWNDIAGGSFVINLEFAAQP